MKEGGVVLRRREGRKGGREGDGYRERRREGKGKKEFVEEQMSVER